MGTGQLQAEKMTDALTSRLVLWGLSLLHSEGDNVSSVVSLLDVLKASQAAQTKLQALSAV